MAKQDLSPLVIKAQQGDKNALNDLISACYQDIYYFAFKTVKNEDLAADITQESCMEIITSLDKLREPTAFTVWARRITYHQCTRHFRETKEFQAEENEDGETILDTLADESDGVMPEQVVEDKEFQKTMQDMLDSLPPEQRSALMLYYYDKLSVKQIADIHGTTEGTVKSRLNYGRKAVKGKVEEYEKKNGVKLHSIAPLPLLLYFLFRLGKENAPKASAAAVAGVVEAAGTAIGVAGATGAAKVVMGTAGAAVVKKAAASVATKVIAAVLAVTLTAGAAIGGIALLQGEKEPDRDDTQNNKPTNPSLHLSHTPSQWMHDENSHWSVCECGETVETGEHIFSGRECTVCGRMTASEGLELRAYDDYAVVEGLGNCTDSDVVIPTEYEGLPVTMIINWAFKDCVQLTSVTLPSSITEIGSYAFYKCPNIKSVSLNEGLTDIGIYAFQGCTSLETITLPESLKYLGGGSFEDCASLKSIAIPQSIHDLDNSMFYGCESLSAVTLPDTLTRIGDSTFWGCKALESIQLPESLIRIDRLAFRDCTSLKDVNIPRNVTIIGEYAFYNCTALTKIAIPGNVKYIEQETFSGCTALAEVSLPNSVAEIRSNAFEGCVALEKLTLPAFLVRIGDWAFSNCTALKSVVIPDTVTRIQHDAFAGCSALASVTLPSGITYLDYNVFWNCSSLQSIVIPDGVQSIGHSAFDGCTSLTSVTIPASVTDIEDLAVGGCALLTDIYYQGTQAQWAEIDKADGFFLVWDDGAGEYTVHCTDGDLSKDAA